MISGVDELDSVARCIEMGAADYLPKPFNPVILAARVRASLADKRLHDLEVASRAAQAEMLRTIERQKTELSRFLSPQVAALISSPEGEQLLAGHRREHDVCFCDLRGFTAFSDTAEPEELLGVLREYHAAMGELIVEYGGTLEHFAGDGMMVFFNDPVLQDDHVARAVRMAVAMRERFATLAAPGRSSVYELGLASASRPATPRSGESASRAATTTAWSARPSSSPRGSAPPRRPARSCSTRAPRGGRGAGRRRTGGRAAAQGLQSAHLPVNVVGLPGRRCGADRQDLLSDPGPAARPWASCPPRRRMASLIDRREYAALADCTYLNQASLGLIPRVSLDASSAVPDRNRRSMATSG